MLLNITLVGDREILARLDAMPEAVARELRGDIRVMAAELASYVVTHKLHGQVLHQRSGQLARSIQSRVESTDLTVRGFVFSAGDVKYAGIHEFGGRTPPHDIYPKVAEALRFTINGRVVFAKVVHHPGSVMPERSFLRSSLSDNRAGYERRIMESAYRAAAHQLRAA